MRDGVDEWVKSVTPMGMTRVGPHEYRDRLGQTVLTRPPTGISTLSGGSRASMESSAARGKNDGRYISHAEKSGAPRASSRSGVTGAAQAGGKNDTKRREAPRITTPRLSTARSSAAYSESPAPSVGNEWNRNGKADVLVVDHSEYVPSDDEEDAEEERRQRAQASANKQQQQQQQQQRPKEEEEEERIEKAKFALAEQSFRIWGRINPGFIDDPTPSRGTVASQMDFYSNRTFKYPTKEFNKRADGFTEFVEAKARFDAMSKRKPT